MEKLKSRFRLAPTYTLLWLAAAALASVASCSDGGPSTSACVAPETECDGTCIDTGTSASHCGACGVACGSDQTCRGGACVAACEDGLAACGDGCVDTQSDEAHCGRCDNACEGGQTCRAGECQDGGCPVGRADCGGTCVDVASDPNNCGECGKACADEQTCEAGECQDEGCSEGLTDCNGACVNLQTDTGHCGECTTACTGDQTCVAGACEDGCGSGLTACDGVEVCVDLQTSADHCGACGTACNDTQVCQAGACACTVSPGHDLGSDVPQIVNGTTAGLPNTYSPTCSATSSSERIYSFTAETAGVYSFDSRNSGYSVVLALLDAGGCSEIACSADPSAVITADLAAGQTVFVVVDGAGGEAGTFELSVTRASASTCPTGSFGPAVPQTITGSTVGRPNSTRPTATPDCLASSAAANSPDAGYTFTALVAGDYTFDTFGSSFDTLLHVHDASCRGAQLACNDDDETGSEQSEVTVTLAAGQTVVVMVDGSREENAGAFRLNVKRAVPPPTCDGSGTCGDGASGCMRCAYEGECADELAACTATIECMEYISCYRTCDTAACRATCRAEDPASAAIYDAMLVCAQCNVCANDCSGSAEIACP
ncbi:MXAN_6577-like cysteine-rich protein [Sorangium sp. So ce375]|uniref:MXAN_6577-like cysteine-rich protein n=1 Tax=Sorangium sp. So ce375 TaxID=3133306 RepID=UPI003F5B6E70